MERNDLRVIEVDGKEWYEEETKSRETWRAICTEKLKSVDDGKVIAAPNNVRIVCEECHKTFNRECDKERHKCITERLKPIYQQKELFIVLFGLIVWVDSQYITVDHTH